MAQPGPSRLRALAQDRSRQAVRWAQDAKPLAHLVRVLLPLQVLVTLFQAFAGAHHAEEGEGEASHASTATKTIPEPMPGFASR